MKQTAQRRAFQLAPLQHWTWLLLAALWMGLMLVAYLGGTHQQSAANPVPWWLVVPFATALLPVGLGVALTHRSIGIEGDRLVIAAALVFARKVPVAELELDKARVLSLDERTELKPMLQLGGFTLPGFNAGHYLLRNRNRAIAWSGSTTLPTTPDSPSPTWCEACPCWDSTPIRATATATT